MKTWSAAKVRKAQAAHGVSVIAVRREVSAGRRAPVEVRAPRHRVHADAALGTGSARRLR